MRTRQGYQSSPLAVLPLVGWPLGVTMFEATGQIAGFVTCYKE